MNNRFSVASVGLAVDGAISRMVHDLTAPPLPPGEERTRAVAKYRVARDGTLALIQDLTQEQAGFFPAARVWSISQIVEHLLLTEELYRTQMRNLIDLARRGEKRNIELTFSDIDNSIAFIPRDMIPKLTVPLNVMNMFLPRAVREAMFRIPLIPAVNPRASQPTSGQSIAALRARAVSSLRATEEIFRGTLPPDLMNKTLSHPIIGTNNIAQIFGILEAHEERHHGQIRALLANPRFPPAIG